MGTMRRWVGTCADCGKRCYPSRKIARKVARADFPGDHLSPYQCGRYWHLGHLDLPMMRGHAMRGSGVR